MDKYYFPQFDVNCADEFDNPQYIEEERPHCKTCGSLNLEGKFVPNGDSDTDPAIFCLDCKSLEVL